MATRTSPATSDDYGPVPAGGWPFLRVVCRPVAPYPVAARSRRSRTLTHEQDILEEARRVIREEADGLEALAAGLSDAFPDAVGAILSAKGRVILSGIGKSGHVANKIAATFASTGTPAQFVHPSEASHGDLGMITPDDVCILISNSGETAELSDLILYTRCYGVRMIAITKRPDSALGREADILLQLPDVPEACSLKRAPTTSTTCTMALGDALAVAVMRQRAFDDASFLRYHPGGSLGLQLLTVSALMHSGDELPLVPDNAPMGDVLVEMTAKGLGIALLTRHGRLTGVITDGDLRRNLSGLMDHRAADIASTDPLTVAPDTLIEEATRLMNERKVSVLPVVADEDLLVGVLHIHDALRAGAKP